MRQLARFDDEDPARTLGDVLLADGIESTVHEGRDGGWLVWVVDEERLPDARSLLEVWTAAPDDPRFAGARRAADQTRDLKRREARAARRLQVDAGRRMREAGGGVPAITTGLVLACVGMAIVTELGQNSRAIADFVFDLRATLAGQVWRPVTTLFIHAGPLHLLFNGYMLWGFGQQVEARVGRLGYTGMVLLFGVGSVLAEHFGSGAPAVGMSGVVYGLFGYAWIRGRLDPASGFAVSPSTVTILMGWMALGFSGLLGNMANFAHLGGFALGAGLAWLTSQRRRR